MRMLNHASIAWHMNLAASIYPGWDAVYAQQLLERFSLRPAQMTRSLSRGEHAKALLLLVLARRPRLLVLDEPTSGLDPVARQEVLTEFMDVLLDEDRSIVFSSHNTADVERISDRITFIDRGRIIDSSDKETFLEHWRRLHLQLNEGAVLPQIPSLVVESGGGRLVNVTTNDYTPALHGILGRAGVLVREVHRMTLEEIFVTNVMRSRKEQGK
jgi:ABC-2 type transport system ATP-binding protein